MQKHFSLNRNQLKYIVILAMLLDHIAWLFIPTASTAGWICHFIGRLTGPVMAYFIYEGYIHTSNIKRYAIRLGVFAVISWMPFSLYETGTFPTTEFGVIYTLFFGLMALIVWDSHILPYWIKPFFLTAIVLLSSFGDWGMIGVLWPLFLYIYRNDYKKRWIFFYGLGLVEVFDVLFANGTPLIDSYGIGIMLAPPILQFVYNGQPGNKNVFNKWFFYIFYPLHLLIIAVIYYYGSIL